MLEDTFLDCQTAAVAVQTAALAGVALSLAIFAFTGAFIVRQIRSWRAWTNDQP